MGRHRDNFRSEDLVSYLATKDTSVLTSAKYAQVPNSSVLIFTTGNAPMTFETILSIVAADCRRHRQVFATPKTEY